RAAQLLALRPDLRIAPLRGNVDTRVRKALEGEYDAILLAGAGITRLGLTEHVSEWLPLEVMLPAPGQGALAVLCRASDNLTLNLLAPLEDSAIRLAVTAERAFLNGLGGGCAVPVAAYAECDLKNNKAHITLHGLVISPDGKTAIKVSGKGTNAEPLGQSLAKEALQKGAAAILNPPPRNLLCSAS
ncbi:MAG: hydroxymethylbilane synthase, partial [Anaerolineae bacterium]